MIDQNSQFQAILTAVGEAKQANADALGIPWTFSQMAVGDANGTDPFPDRLQTKLINERRRAPLNQLKPDPKNPGIIIAEQVIPENVGGFWIRELGLYDEDEDLVAVANCAPTFKPLLTQGSGRTQIIRMNLIVSSLANIVLKVDPAVVLATREYVDHSLKTALPEDKEPGSYRQVQVDKRGIVQSGENPTTLKEYAIGIATQEEAEGQKDQDNTKPMTALRVHQAIAKRVAQATEVAFGWAKIATQVQTDTGEDDSTIVTPKKLRLGFIASLNGNGYIIFPSWLAGLVIQWTNSSAIPSGGSGFAYWPIAFPSGCIWALAAPLGSAGNTQPGNVVAGETSATAVNLYNWGLINSPARAIGIGV